MNAAQISLIILRALKEKKLLLWLLLLIGASTGPLITTYIFSRGINALETHMATEKVIPIFLLLLFVASVEIFTRVAAKTRLHVYMEKSFIKAQKELLKNVKVRSKERKPTVQAIRNLTRAIQTFGTYFINTGVAGVVSFISIPFVLFFIDQRVFFIEVALILIYLIATIYYSSIYEKQFERHNEAREKYFIKMDSSNNVTQLGVHLAKTISKLQNIRFFEWASVQNIIIAFEFIITVVIVIDIINGLKGISDLVLILGYTTQSKIFLNSITSDLNRFMQIRAGIERLVITSNGAKRGSVTKLF